MDREDAIDIMARWSLWLAYEAWAETAHGLSDERIDEPTFLAITERMEDLLPEDVGLFTMAKAETMLEAEPCEHGFYRKHWIVKEPDYDETFMPTIIGHCEGPQW